MSAASPIVAVMAGGLGRCPHSRPDHTSPPPLNSTLPLHNQKKFCPEIGLYPYSTKTREALENTSLPTRDFLSAKPEGNLVGLRKP